MKKILKLFSFTSLLLFCFISNVGAIDIKEEIIDLENKNLTINSVVPTSDKGNIVVGQISDGNSDGIIIKYDKNGNIEWKNRYGSSSYEDFYNVYISSDGDYFVLGDTMKPDGEDSPFYSTYKGGWNDIIVVRYDKDGNIKWQKNYGGNDEDGIGNLIFTSDGGFILSGCSYSKDLFDNYKGFGDALIIKCDKNGNIEWKKEISTEKVDLIYGSSEINDNEFVILYNSINNNTSEKESFLIKYNIKGDIIWKKSLSDVGFAGRIINAIDDGFVLTVSDEENFHYLVKIDKDCKVLWKNKIDQDKDFVIGNLINISSGYVVEGFLTNRTPDNIEDSYSLLVKYNNFGEIEYQKKFLIDDGYSFYSAYKIKSNQYILVGNRKEKKINNGHIMYDNTSPVILKITEPLYELVSISDNSFDNDNLEDLTFKCEGDLELLDKVYINDKELPREYYTLKKGSTIITIKKEYLSTLSNGDYILRLQYSDGFVAKTSFKVKMEQKTDIKEAEVKNPNTSDNIGMYSLLFMISFIVISKIILSLKRTNSY